ncbi:terminase large subunit [Klebsiella pneumoniae subsp. pneumoniae]|nr:terminase large subunit [Klebsiella pneumoniae subsp. pneumoniae]
MMGSQGPRPHCALIDEIHEHKNNQVVEMMRAGTKGRRQALIFMITNSGHDKTSVCHDYHEYGRKVAEGSIEMTVSFLSFAPGRRRRPHSGTSPAGKKQTPLLVILFYRSLPA